MPQISDTDAKIINKINYIGYTRKSSVTAKKGNLLLYGPRKCGKTLLAATLSRDWSGPPTKGTGQLLTDCVWVTCEKSATTTLVPWGIEVLEIPLLEIMVQERLSVLKLIEQLPDIFSQTLTPDHENVIFDNGSDFARLIENYYVSNVDTLFNGNTRAMWTQVRNKHLDFRMRLNQAAGARRVVYLMHARPRIEMAGKGADTETLNKNETRKDEAYDRADIMIDVTGVNATGYEAECDLIGVCVKKEVLVDRKMTMQYVLHPNGTDSYVGGHRYGPMWPDTIVNANLRKMLEMR